MVEGTRNTLRCNRGDHHLYIPHTGDTTAGDLELHHVNTAGIRSKTGRRGSWILQYGVTAIGFIIERPVISQIYRRRCDGIGTIQHRDFPYPDCHNRAGSGLYRSGTGTNLRKPVT